ncbi:MAG TPA: Ig-like domain-containing protein, partial [Promineifilum sp.]|nr:Ig-like domain-containing protein [Promineifilum sp.]
AVDDSYTVALGETLTVAAPGVLANDANPGNAPLTAVLVEGPLSGTLSLAADGSFTYTSTEEFAGQDSFTYRADNGLASNVATVTIAVFDPNGPPVAVDDSYIALVGQRLTVAAPGVLANDVNPQANGMTAVLAAGPAHGTLALRADGSFTYTPQAGYQGADQFTYRANNGQPSNVATVRITVSRSGFRVFLPVAVSD